MIQTLQEEYILLGEAKGLRSRTLMLRYAARNALLPVVTNIGIQLGYMLGGVVIAERIFSYPGLGYLLLQAVGEHDYPVIQALIALSAVVTLTANLLASLFYPRLDPRVRAG
jgi:peptide/nickel transport system permease protein